MAFAEHEMAGLVGPTGPAALGTPRVGLAAMMPAQFHDLGVKVPQQGHRPRCGGRQRQMLVGRNESADVVEEETPQVFVRAAPEAGILLGKQLQSLKQPPRVFIHDERFVPVRRKQQNAVGRLRADARQGEQLRANAIRRALLQQVFDRLAALAPQLRGNPHKASRFLSREGDRADQVLHATRIRPRQTSQVQQPGVPQLDRGVPSHAPVALLDQDRRRRQLARRPRPPNGGVTEMRACGRIESLQPGRICSGRPSRRG